MPLAIVKNCIPHKVKVLFSTFLANPKSAIFMFPFSSSNRFSGCLCVDKVKKKIYLQDYYEDYPTKFQLSLGNISVSSQQPYLKVPIDNVHVMDVLKRKENLCCIKTLRIPEFAKHPVKLLYLFWFSCSILACLSI